MSSIGIFYGSSGFNTRKVAEMIRTHINNNAEVRDIADSRPNDLRQYDLLILGTSTWGFGDPQQDWEEFLPELSRLDLSGKRVALFGLGDQQAYPDSFVSGLAPLYQAVLAAGGRVIGSWPIEGYKFNDSTALENGRFVGLALDEDNESAKTLDRVKAWIAQLRRELT